MSKTLEQIIDDSTRKAYDADWTWEEQQAAFKQGWELFTSYKQDGEFLELQRIDEPEDGTEPVFSGDTDAWIYVKSQALKDNALAQKALRRVAVENPAEYENIQFWKAGEEISAERS